MEFLWFLEALRTPVLDHLMQFITYFGQEAAAVMLICLLYWCVNKDLALKIGFSYFMAGLAVQTLKITLRVPRPWMLDPSFPPVKSSVPGATGYSFPSGHTQSAACLYGSLGLHTQKRSLKIICLAAIVLVAFSRMYLGCHTLWDVLASLVISAVFIWFVQRCIPYFLTDLFRMRLLFAVLLAICLGVLGYSFLLLEHGILTQANAAGCCKAAGAGLGFAVGWYLEATRLRFSTFAPGLRVQAVKFSAGIAGLLCLTRAIPFIIGESMIAKIIKYFILVLWIMVIYPAVFSRILSGKDRK